MENDDKTTYLRKYQFMPMPSSEKSYTDYNTGLPISTGEPVWSTEEGKVVTTDMPNAKADYALQYGNPRFELTLPNINVVRNQVGNETKSIGEEFQDRYIRLSNAPISSKSLTQEQNDIATAREVELARQHRKNQEFNRLMDNFFGANWLRPSQWVGAFNPSGINTNTTFAERLLLGTDNYGLWNPESQFYRKHPYLSEGLNIAFDFAMPSSLKGVTLITKAAIPVIKPYVLHPTYKTYYHGTPHSYSFNEIEPYSNYNIGLHVGDKNIATEFATEFASQDKHGTVYKIRAPRPSAETIDISLNDYRLLSTDYHVNARPKNNVYPIKSYAGDRLRIKMLSDAGAEPSFENLDKLHTEKSVTLNLRERFPKIANDPNLSKAADEVLQLSDRWDIPQKTINKKATELLSEAGYKTVKYVNPIESPPSYYSSGKPYYSYFITDPNVMHLVPEFNPKLKFDPSLLYPVFLPNKK